MSLEMNKIAAAVLTAGVVAMGSGFVAHELVHPEYPEENAYQVAVPETDGDAAQPEEPGLEPVLPLLADADPANGEALFRACAACHTAEEGGANRVGPALWGVAGRQIATVDGFNYSAALSERSDEAWTYEHLNGFIAAPREWAPGTAMAYGGMRSVEDRADLIAYLREQSGDPLPLPSEEEIQAVAAETTPADAEGAEDAAAAEETDGEAAEAAADEAPAGGDSEIGGMIAAADPAAGQNVARPCMACHTFEEGGPARVGPNLYDIVGAEKAAKEGFNYSDALTGLGGDWNYEDLWGYLENPREFAPGNRMAFPGVKDAENLAALIAYMREQSSDPAPLPGGGGGQAEAAEAAPAEAEGAEDAAAAEETDGEAAEATADAQAPAGGDSELRGMIAAADPAAGQNAARPCMACHTFEEGGPARVGPNLYDIVGAEKAAKEGFNYSDALTGLGGDWNYEDLWSYLENPRDFAPGTRMAFPGVRDPENLAALIAYMREQGSNPPPLE